MRWRVFSNLVFMIYGCLSFHEFSAHDAGGRGAELLDKGGLRLVAEGERSEGRGGGLRRRSTRSHGAQGVRSATNGSLTLRGEPEDADGREDAPETRRWGVGCSVMVGRKRRHAQSPR